MQDIATPLLKPWESFYVIVGSSAGALTGLQFVVIALIAETRNRSTTAQVDAFGTPTVVHFCAALLVSAILSAPWHEVSSVAALMGACGAFGVGYSAVVTRRTRRQIGYDLVLEDVVWHIVLPFIAYGILLFAAFGLMRYPADTLFAIAASTLILLFVGIHNAWDTVSYVVVPSIGLPKEGEEKQ